MNELEQLKKEKERLWTERLELDETAKLKDEIKKERKLIKQHKHRKAIKISKSIGKGLLKTGKVLFDLSERATRPKSEPKVSVRKLDKVILELAEKEKEDKKQ